MSQNNKKESTTRGTDSNPDPITGAPGAHPVGTGLGAAAGGAASGAAIGSIAGPLGTVAGVVVGAVVGGLMGKAAAEAIDPTNEEEYWKENYQREPYVDKGKKYDDYADAYRTGYEGYAKHGTASSFEKVEPELRKSYEQNRKSSLEWDKARDAARAAWERVGTKNLERLIGYEVVDQKENTLGTVENLWADHNGRPAYLGISLDRSTAKTFVVPSRSAEVSHKSRRVRLPFLSDKLQGAPSYGADTQFTESMESEINRYYGLSAPEPSKSTQPTTGDRTIQLKEESVSVGKREVEAGGVRLRKIVRSETVNQPVELRKEEVVVERVPITGAKPANSTFEGEEIYVPLMQEEAVVAKNTVVTEEVRVGKKSTVDHQTISETVRKEDLEIDKQGTSNAWAQHDNHWRKSYLTSSYYEKGRPYEDYQGAYRTGFEGYSRYKGRRFEDVENDLRNDYDRNRGNSSLTWEKVKQAVRDGWHRVERALPGDADHDGR